MQKKLSKEKAKKSSGASNKPRMQDAVEEKSGEKKSVVQILSEKFSKRFGSDSISSLGDINSSSEVLFGISSQSLLLDIALGRPGIPSGRIVELFGNESTGKTLLGLHFLAEAQRLGGVSVFCDTERGIDQRFLKRLGLVFGDRAILLQPPCLEDSFTMIEETILALRKVHKKAPIAVLYDSVAGCPSKIELEAGYEDSSPASVARFLSRGVKKLKDLISQRHVALVFTNQLRQQIGVYGRNEHSFGGKALKFFASVRIEVRRTGIVMGNDKQPRGIEIEAKVVKNKLAAPFGTARMALLFTRGLDKARDLLDASVLLEEITEKAGFYYLPGEEKRFSARAFPIILKEKLGGWETYKQLLTKKAVSLGRLVPYGEMSTDEVALELPDDSATENLEEGKEC